MRASIELHDRVADLLTYPGPDSVDVPSAIAAVVRLQPEAAGDLEGLAGLADDPTPGTLEETFCRTFDNNADYALEVGWQIWGENYDRGAFLVRMRDFMRRAGVTETAELPDHLSHVLRVLGRMEDHLATTFTDTTVLPAARKMREAFEDENHPYRGVLDVVLRVIESNVPSREPIDV